MVEYGALEYASDGAVDSGIGHLFGMRHHWRHAIGSDQMKSVKKVRPFLRLENAAFRLGERVIFENSSWIFGRNEHWAIVGENGSGKSLLGDAVRGKLPLAHGELRYHFRPLEGLSPEQCIGHVGFEDRKADVHGRVLQSRWNSSEVELEETVGEHLSFERVMEVNRFEVNRRLRESKRDFDARRRRAIRLIEIGSLWERKMVSLSNGEMQKVLIAKALCLPIRLLVLDEPFTGLDVASRKHFVEVLSRLMRSGLKVLFITAREEELPPAISHAIRVENCTIKQVGKVRDVVGRRNRLHQLSPLNPLNDLIGGGGERTKSKIKIKTRSRNKSKGEELVRMKDVTVRYGETVVFRRVNWTVREGESWALLGPNGSGKTTLLSLITGDHPQVYGNQVTVFGRRRGTGESVWDLRKQIGFVSPELQVHFDDSMSCLEVVESGFADTVGLFDDVSALQRTAARRWLRRFDLLAVEEEPLFALSAGLGRLALLARALVKLPRLLILDEPCQGLDAAHRDLFNSVVSGLLREKVTTTIYVTHREHEIPRQIRRVLRLGPVDL